MAESTLAIGYDDLVSAIRTAAGVAAYECDAIVQTGYRHFLYPQQLAEVTGKPLPAHRWSFLDKRATLAIGSDTTGTATSVSGTVTATGSIFYPSMVGCTIVVTDYDGAGTDLTATISTYTSATVVVIDETDNWASKAITVSDRYRYELPDAFGALKGRFTYPDDTPYGPIGIVQERYIRDLRSSSSSSGNPTMCAVYARTASGDYDPEEDGTRYDVAFFPTPGTAYTLTYDYSVKVDKLDTTTNKWPLGGLDHSETVRLCCLAAFELTAHQAAGTNTQMALAALRASILRDQDHHTPESVGRVIDPQFRPSRQRHERGGYVYYEGVRMVPQ